MAAKPTAISPKPYFLLDDPKAVKVLRAYFYETPKRYDPHIQKMRALAKWRELNPGASAREARNGVAKLLEIDRKEQTLLLSYSQIMIWNARVIAQAVQTLRSQKQEQAKRNSDLVWRVINEALHSAAALSRMFDALPMKGKGGIHLREYRAQLLRRAFGINKDLDKKYLPTMRAARDILDHFEEYMDSRIEQAMQSGRGFNDLTCLTTQEAKRIRRDTDLLRWYDITRSEIHILDHIINLYDLDSLFTDLMWVWSYNILPRGRYQEFKMGLLPRESATTAKKTKPSPPSP